MAVLLGKLGALRVVAHALADGVTSTQALTAEVASQCATIARCGLIDQTAGAVDMADAALSALLSTLTTPGEAGYNEAMDDLASVFSEHAINVPTLAALARGE